MVAGKIIRNIAIVMSLAVTFLSACDRKEERRTSLRVSGTLGETKVTISEETDRVKSCWQTGDVIYGFWNNGSANLSLSYRVSAIDANGKASFTKVSGTEPEADGTPVHMVYTSGGSCSAFDASGKASADISLQDGTFGGLADKIIFCATAQVESKSLHFIFQNKTAIVNVKEVSGIASGEQLRGLQFTAPGIGRAEVSLVDGELTLTPSSDISFVRAEFTGGIAPTTPVWLMTVPVNALKATANTGSAVYSKQVSKQLKAGSCHVVTKLSVNADDSFLDGEFTVDEEGHKVRFAKGNLQATRSGGHVSSFSIAASQYSFLATPDNPMDVSSNGTFDLFSWSTPNSDFGLRSEENADFSGDFLDWGDFVCPGCRTLSSEEFGYVLDNYDNFEGNVGDIHGLFLRPVPYTGEAPLQTDYTTTEFSTMEASGTVFLPGAGYRLGSTVDRESVGNEGKYWTATSDDIYQDDASSLSFPADPYPYTFIEESRRAGNSVRLVVDVSR